ncbi:hypothetical protein QYF36_012169 [Acer negundo]|nr:hypothetical protein QYF36_012169 [Acer negundo]
MYTSPSIVGHFFATAKCAPKVSVLEALKVGVLESSKVETWVLEAPKALPDPKAPLCGSSSSSSAADDGTGTKRVRELAVCDGTSIERDAELAACDGTSI